MDLYKLQVSKDSEWAAMHELGKMGEVHVVDLNAEAAPTELPYTN